MAIWDDIIGQNYKQGARDESAYRMAGAEKGEALLEEGAEDVEREMGAFSRMGRYGARRLKRRMPALSRRFTAEDFETDPGYQFRLEQGLNALQSRMGSSRSPYGSAAMTGVTEFAQDLASEEYGNAFNRFMAGNAAEYGMLSGITGLGMRGSESIADARMAAAEGSAGMYNQAYTGSGEAINQANALYTQRQGQLYDNERAYAHDFNMNAMNFIGMGA